MEYGEHVKGSISYRRILNALGIAMTYGLRLTCLPMMKYDSMKNKKTRFNYISA